MSVAEDLAAMYADAFLTVPVVIDGLAGRGFFAVETTATPDGYGGVVQTRETTLRVLTDAGWTLAEERTLTVGAKGAADAAVGTAYVIRSVRPTADGLETELAIARVQT